MQDGGQQAQQRKGIKALGLRLDDEQHPQKTGSDGGPAHRTHLFAQEDCGKDAEKNRGGQVDRDGIGHGQVEQRPQVHQGGHGVHTRAHHHLRLRSQGDPRHGPQALHHSQHQGGGHHPAQEDELRGRQALAGVFHQGVVGHKTRHRRTHVKDAAPVGGGLGGVPAHLTLTGDSPWVFCARAGPAAAAGPAQHPKAPARCCCGRSPGRCRSAHQR